MADLEIFLKIISDSKDLTEVALATDVVTRHFEELNTQIEATRASAAKLRGIGRDITQISREISVLGIAVTGGIFAAANKYVKDAKEATATTEAWKAAQEDLNKSGERFGAVAASVALPALQKAAELAEKAAGFVEKHPDLLKAALNTGAVVATLGAIGLAVGQGIKLSADVALISAFVAQKQVAAQQEKAALVMVKAGQDQIEAALLMERAAGKQVSSSEFNAVDASRAATPAAGLGASAVAVITSPAGILALAAGATLAASKLDDSLTGLQKTLSKTGETGKQGSAIIGALETVLSATSLPLLGVVHDFKLLPDLFKQASAEIKKLFGIDLTKLFGSNPNTPTASSFLGGSQETQDKLVKTYEDYKAADLALVAKHYEDRQKIIDNALASEKAADAQLANKLADINNNINKSEADAADSFHKDDLRKEEDYLHQRAEIASSGGEEIVKIEQDSQERIKKIRLDYEDKIANDRNRRDALALVQDRKAEGRAISEETANANKEIARRRKDVAQRLQELDYQFNKERARRLEDYQQKIVDLEAQRAAEQQQAKIAHDAEIKRLEAEKADKLKQLDATFNEERKRRYTAFIAAISDLNKYLLADGAARNASYNIALGNLKAFLAQYNASLATITGGTSSSLSGQSIGGGLATPTASTGGAVTSTGTTSSFWTQFLNNLGIHDDGGYVGKSVARMAWNGQPEFVMNNQTVRAAESVIGGRLSQESIMRRLVNGGGLTLNYTGRFDGEVTSSMRRAVKGDIEKGISSFLAKAAA